MRGRSLADGSGPYRGYQRQRTCWPAEDVKNLISPTNPFGRSGLADRDEVERDVRIRRYIAGHTATIADSFDSIRRQRGVENIGELMASRRRVIGGAAKRSFLQMINIALTTKTLDICLKSIIIEYLQAARMNEINR